MQAHRVVHRDVRGTHAILVAEFLGLLLVVGEHAGELKPLRGIESVRRGRDAGGRGIIRGIIVATGGERGGGDQRDSRCSTTPEGSFLCP